MINKEEAVLAYRLILGREPENEDVLHNLCQNTHTYSALSEVLLTSPEFQQRMGDMLSSLPKVVRHRHPLILPQIPVATIASDDLIEHMFERIHQQWENLGRNEPFWSVVTQPHYLQSEFQKHRDQFYGSGNFICQVFLASLRRSGINPADLNTCLDFGCGVGRVTMYLAGAFANVIASDISANHLQLANQYLQSKQIKNVTLQHLETVYQIEQLPVVDAIFSVITLQHNPPPVIAWMLKKLLGKLRSGGVAFLQIPTYKNGYIFEVERYLNSTPPDTLEMHFFPQPDVFNIVAEADCICLEVREDGMAGDEDKLLSNTFLIQKK